MKDHGPRVFVGFTGKAGAGKDYVADLVIEELELGYGIWGDKVPWAQGVREEIEMAISGGLHLPKLWEKPTEETMIRPLLQWWGTDFRRAQDPDYWVKWGLETADALPGTKVILFTDTRFHNEVAAVYQRGGFIVNVQAPEEVRIERIGRTPDHESEAYADTLQRDFIVYNDGTDKPDISGIIETVLKRLWS